MRNKIRMKKNIEKQKKKKKKTEENMLRINNFMIKETLLSNRRQIKVTCPIQ